ncbi:MAG TPA: hypothetical protein VK850_19630 [Candidatus Binatia bacterium]|nr:hypothetical protein [Candidatus Binatia bacterium]
MKKIDPEDVMAWAMAFLLFAVGFAVVSFTIWALCHGNLDK